MKFSNSHLCFFTKEILIFPVLVEFYQATRQMNANRSVGSFSISLYLFLFLYLFLSLCLSLIAFRSIIPARKIWILNAFDISGLDILRQLSCICCCCRCFRKSNCDKLFSLIHVYMYNTHTWTHVLNTRQKQISVFIQILFLQINFFTTCKQRIYIYTGYPSYKWRVLWSKYIKKCIQQKRYRLYSIYHKFVIQLNFECGTMKDL